MRKYVILRIEAIKAISIETYPDHARRICKQAFGINASQGVGFSAVILIAGHPGSVILRYPSVGLIRKPDRSVSVLCYIVDFAEKYTIFPGDGGKSVSYTHLRAHETVLDLVCRLLLEKKKKS